jgi:histidinol-phosphate aminotransferase
MNVEALVAGHIRSMQPYTPIVPFEVLSERLGIPVERIVKLDANENLYGPSPRALAALRESGAFHIYPDPEQRALRDAIGAYIGVPAAHILCGAGGDEVIDLIGRLFIEPGDAIIDTPPTFGMYKWEADVVGARYVKAPRNADFSLDVPAIERAVHETPRAKMVFVTNPNNPDGSVTPRETLLRLLALPVIVVVDEAYIDFSDQVSLAPLVAAHDNLIVLRTFSKLAAMAGMRTGYGVFPEPIIRHLWKIKQPYTPTVASSAMAVAALEDREWTQRCVTAIVAERARMGGLLGELGWLRPLPSQSNFLLCRVVGRDALQVKQALERRGVLVRYFDKDGLRDCIRISVGKPEHTDALLAALTAQGSG